MKFCGDHGGHHWTFKTSLFPIFYYKKGLGHEILCGKLGLSLDLQTHPSSRFVLKSMDSVTTFCGGNGGHAWTVKQFPRLYFVLKKRERVTTFFERTGGNAWTVKHIPRPYFVLKSRDSVMTFFERTGVMHGPSNTSLVPILY
jgi:hypothetical protein